jgi:hypothetical protein
MLTPFPAATQLLRRRQIQPHRRRQALRLALLAASYAALKLHPPQLFTAIGELFKQQRQLLKLLGPTESMLLLWAFGRVGHSDPPAQLLLTQRAATQVGFWLRLHAAVLFISSLQLLLNACVFANAV